AVWTGNEMIIWGGRDTLTGNLVNSGGRYNPANDTWSVDPTSTSGAPSTRGYHSAVWSGSEMIIWGGSELDGGSFVNTGGRYDPSADTWGAPTDTFGSPVPRMFHSAVWTGSEMIVWGGYGGCADPGICPALGLRDSG